MASLREIDRDVLLLSRMAWTVGLLTPIATGMMAIMTGEFDFWSNLYAGFLMASLITMLGLLTAGLWKITSRSMRAVRVRALRSLQSRSRRSTTGLLVAE